MSLQERIYSVLIVSASDNLNKNIIELLPVSKYNPITVVKGVSEAKRRITARDYDFVVVNSPLPDDSGIRFAIDCSHSHNAAVLIFVRNEVHDEIHDRVAEHGVFTLPKPTSRQVLNIAFNWMISARERIRKTEQKTLSVEERMAEIRIINRAKLLLISEKNMTESDAHHFIEKSAMDRCIPKKQAAQKIIDELA